jgi:DNA invertase Pin-like site-specific DNA recombinase
MKDAISYIRVSSDEQADSGLGLEAQRQRIAAYCTMKGLHLAVQAVARATMPPSAAPCSAPGST